MIETALPARLEGARPTLTALSLLALPVVAILIFGISLAFGVNGDDASILAVALATGFLALVPLALDQGRAADRRHLLISLLCLSYLMYFVLPVFTQYFMISEPVDGVLRTSNVAPEDLLTGQGVILLAILSTYVGYFYPVSRIAAQFLPKPRFDWSHESALMVALVMIPMGWFVTVGGQFGLIPSRLGSGALGAVATASYMALGLLAIILSKRAQ